jgi:hypothetical protein
MKISLSLQVALVVMMVFALSVPLAEAQVGRGQGGQGRGRGRGPADGQGGRYYDPTTEVTLTGTVDEVLLQAGRGGATGLHLLVTDEGETFDVHVGPTFYLFPEGLEVVKGDQVTVTGSRIVMDGAPALIVKQISKGDFAITLRDDIGLPVWAGQGPQSAQGGRGPGVAAAPSGAVFYGRGRAAASGGAVAYGRGNVAVPGGTAGYGRGYARVGYGRGGSGRGAGLAGGVGVGYGRGPCGRGLGRGAGRGVQRTLPGGSVPGVSSGSTGG